MSMWELLHEGHQSGVEPWQRLWSRGHGDTWLANAAYTRRHLGSFREALACDP